MSTISPVPTYFCLHHEQSDYPTSSVVIVPSAGKWNDFGLKNRGRYFLTSALGEDFAGDLHLAFIGSDDDVLEVVRTRLRELGAQRALSSEFPVFFTLQSDINSYRKLVDALGAAEATAMLLALNDLVAVQRNKLQAWLPQALASPAFQYSFIRESEAYFAFLNAGSVLDGLKEERLGGTSEQLRLEFKLPTFSEPHEFDITFDKASLLPKQLAVLIGQNGTGKSRALHAIARSLLADDDRLRDLQWERPRFSRLIAICSPGNTSATFPRRPPNPRIRYIRLSLNQRAGRIGDSNNPLIALARSNDTIAGSSRWDIFWRAVTFIFPEQILALPAVDSVWVPPITNSPRAPQLERYVLLSELRSGGEFDRLRAYARVKASGLPVRIVDGTAVPLSSGQQSFITLAAQLCAHVENGCLVLIDEPETHLHPNLQSSLIALLETVLRATGSCSVIATHSAFIAREVPRSQVHVLHEVEAGCVTVSKPRLKTFGAEVGAISAFVFGDDFGERLLKRFRTLVESKDMDLDRAAEELKDELPSEAIMQLRAMGSEGEGSL